MSKRKEIIDGMSSFAARGGMVYTCRCGWIDLGHARESKNDKTAIFWDDVVHENGIKCEDGKGYQLKYSQSMSALKMTATHRGQYYVKLGLSRLEKESVALAIFAEVSYGFETMQGNDFYRAFTDSGFSAEDLVSDLIGFYRVVKPERDYIWLCEPVSKKAALDIWDTYGAAGSNKNKFFAPFLYPCSECKQQLSGPVSSLLPPELMTIFPAKKGELFRDWDGKKDRVM